MTKTELKKALKKTYHNYKEDYDPSSYCYFVDVRIDGYTLLGCFNPRDFRLNEKGDLLWVSVMYKEFEEDILKKRLRKDDDLVIKFHIGELKNQRVWTLKLVWNENNDYLYLEPIEEITDEERRRMPSLYK